MKVNMIMKIMKAAVVVLLCVNYSENSGVIVIVFGVQIGTALTSARVFS